MEGVLIDDSFILYVQVCLYVRVVPAALPSERLEERPLLWNGLQLGRSNHDDYQDYNTLFNPFKC